MILLNWLKKQKRMMITCLIFSGGFFFAGYFQKYELPKIKRWFLIEVEAQSRQHAPLRIWPQGVTLQALPPGITFYNVKILPQKGFEKYLSPTKVDRLSAQLSLWGLLKAQFRIGEIRVDGSKIQLRIPAFNENKKTPFLSLEMLKNIPIDGVSLRNISITSELQEPAINISVKDLNLNLESKFNTLRAGLIADEVKIRKANEPASFQAGLETRFLIDKEGLYFSVLKLLYAKSHLSASGAVLGSILDGQPRQVRAKVRGLAQVDELEKLLRKFYAENKIPKMNGEIEINSSFDYTFGNKKLTSDIALTTQNLKIDRYDIGQLKIAGESDQKAFVLREAIVENRFGQIQLAETKLLFDDNLSFQTEFRTQGLNLNSFLDSIGIEKTPVHVQLKAQLPCAGRIKNKFQLNCYGTVDAEKFDVTTRSKETGKNFEIVAIPAFSATGTVKVDTESVSYNTKLTIGKSSGESNGSISYKNGFKINYSSPRFNFSDIRNLASLKPEGQLELRGQTSGDSHSAQFDLQAKGENLWISDYGLGEARFDLKYNKGTLQFKKFEGRIGSSSYKSEFNIDLKNDQISLGANFPFLDSTDLQNAISRKMKVPVEITGTGSAHLQMKGPLEISKLSYDLNSSFFRGQIANETYDQLIFNIQSQAGRIETKKISLAKGRSQMIGYGYVEPSGKANLQITGQNFRIEQSENLNKIKINLSGNLNFDMNLTGLISKPDIQMNGVIKEMTVGDQPAEDSIFNLSLREGEFTCQANLMGDAIKLKYKQEFNPSAARHLDFEAKGWNFAQTFSIFSDSLRNTNYITRTTGRMSITIPNQNPQAFSADIQVSDLFLKNGRTEMSTTKPLQLKVQNGQFYIPHFEISGEDTYLRLKSDASTAKNLALTLEGRVDMSLATLVTPFLDDLRGFSKFSFQLAGPILTPQLTGSAYIEEGLVRFKGFGHALEQVQGDAIFNQEKIIVNSIKGRIGGGPFSGSGQIVFQNLSSVIVDAKGQFNDSRFNVPEGFKTRGSGDFFVKGSWFPYTVGVNYYVESGSIEKLAAAKTKDAPEIKPSSYLPKFLSAQRFSPVILDLDVNLKRALPVKIEVNRMEIRAEVSGEMKVQGPPDSPKLNGRIYIARGGQVTFRNNTFDILSGTVEYFDSEPENPSLNVRAEAKVTANIKANETRDFDIDLRVQGTAQKPQITVSSVPPLPESELISLLTLGFINVERTSETDDQAGEIQNTTYQMSSAIINEALGISKVLESSIGVKFDINSSYDSTDKAEKHKLSFSKQWTPKFGTSASREIGKKSTNNVKAEYKLNRNLSVIGEWEGQEATATEATTSDKENNIFGLDIEYKVEFK